MRSFSGESGSCSSPSLKRPLCSSMVCSLLVWGPSGPPYPSGARSASAGGADEREERGSCRPRPVRGGAAREVREVARRAAARALDAVGQVLVAPVEDLGEQEPDEGDEVGRQPLG